MKIYILQDTTDGAIIGIYKDEKECIQALKKMYFESPDFYVYDIDTNDWTNTNGYKYFNIQI